MKYNKKELLKIFKYVFNNEIDNSYKEINDIKDKLYILFKPYEYYLNSKNIKDMNDLLKYVNISINYLLYSEYKDLVDINLLDIIVNNYDDNDFLIENKLNMIFNPKIEYDNSPRWFIKKFYCILYTILWCDKKDLAFKYKKFDRLFKIFRELDNNDQMILVKDFNIITLLLTYCYLNDIDDYNLVYKYISDKNYIFDYLNMNGIKMKQYEVIELDEFDSVTIFNLIPNIYQNKIKVLK